MTRSFILLVCVMLSGCGGGDSGTSSADPTPAPLPPEYEYQRPELKTDQLSVSHYEDVGISDIQLLKTMMNGINSGKYPNIDSVLILKDNQLFFEENRRTTLDVVDIELGNSDIELHTMMSVSKSFVSALTGVAIDNGDIPGVDVLVHDYFERYFPLKYWDDRKSGITLENYLSMRHGYKGEENSVYSWVSARDDYVSAVLDLEMDSIPGTQFNYSTAVSHTVGALLEQATGVPVIDYFEQRLFEPMGIEKVHWSVSPIGRPETGRGLFLSTRSMAKFGLLFLNKGLWNGQRLLSESWVNASTQKRVNFEDRPFQTGYAWYWWTHTFNVNQQDISTYQAEGNGGQYIWVIDELNAVVVFTGTNFNSSLALKPYEMMSSYILPVLLNTD